MTETGLALVILFAFSIMAMHGSDAALYAGAAIIIATVVAWLWAFHP